MKQTRNNKKEKKKKIENLRKKKCVKNKHMIVIGYYFPKPLTNMNWRQRITFHTHFVCIVVIIIVV